MPRQPRQPLATRPAPTGKPPAPTPPPSPDQANPTARPIRGRPPNPTRDAGKPRSGPAIWQFTDWAEL